MSRACSRELVAIGIDVVEVDKVHNLLSYGRRRLRRVFNLAELAMAGEPNPHHFHRSPSRVLACVFAVKEAVFKSLGRGWGQGVRWSEVCVGREGSGHWSVSLSGQALHRLKELGGDLVQVCAAAAGKHAMGQAFIYKYQITKLDSSIAG
ncbi:MAG: 4'-phosphopantetheinyl transferase superfamily protein [bacterium]|jgi:phosphopantetheine--protein transferase-like protein